MQTNHEVATVELSLPVRPGRDLQRCAGTQCFRDRQRGQGALNALQHYDSRSANGHHHHDIVKDHQRASE